MRQKITIATRESKLALWQANYVAAKLREAWPDLEVNLLPQTTKGDEILERPLVEIGGKGLFIKELEVALLAGRADIAVHSLKDMTAEVPEGLCLAAVTAREDPRDAFVSNRYKRISDLPSGAVVGTSSLRRTSQLLHHRSDLAVKPLRGNLQTRLKKLDDGGYDGIILAAAGLKRMELENRISSYLSTEGSIPACGQGIMAIEAVKDPEVLRLISCLHDEKVSKAVRAERAFLKRVGGDCKVPAGMYAREASEGKLSASAFISSLDGKRFFSMEMEESEDEAETMGVRMAEELLNRGGRDVLLEIQREG